jgi:AcrR family transcriptional regulator
MSPEAKVERLPRGRHKLSRAEVVESQRNRMLLAMAEAAAEKGYAKTSVADVLERAGVSRETFYEQFSSKEDCFLATFDAAAGILLAEIGSAVANDTESGDRVRSLVGNYLRGLAVQPHYSRVYLVEANALGAVAIGRRAAIQQRFVTALVQMLGLSEEYERFACEILVGGVATMVTSRLALDDKEGLLALEDPLVDLIKRLLEATGRGPA